MPGRSICCLERLSYVKAASGKHACLCVSLGLRRDYPSDVDELPNPETEKSPSLKFCDRCRVEGQINQIFFAFDLVQFDKEHIVSRDSLRVYHVSSGHYPQI
jgi:hypothetical protein